MVGGPRTPPAPTKRQLTRLIAAAEKARAGHEAMAEHHRKLASGLPEGEDKVTALRMAETHDGVVKGLAAEIEGLAKAALVAKR